MQFTPLAGMEIILPVIGHNAPISLNGKVSFREIVETISLKENLKHHTPTTTKGMTRVPVSTISQFCWPNGTRKSVASIGIGSDIQCSTFRPLMISFIGVVEIAVLLSVYIKKRGDTSSGPGCAVNAKAFSGITISLTNVGSVLSEN